jgi:hypothetical protein
MAYKKFEVGDQVHFDEESNTHYIAHGGHVGELVAIHSYPKNRGAGTVVTYEMKCECGSTLHPQAHHVTPVIA